jgi:hypothetical protein
MTNSALITSQGLVVHQYNDIEPLGALYPASAGLAADQLHYITGMIRAYQLTGSADARSQAEAALYGLLTYIFRGAEGQEAVSLTNTFSPHNMFAVKSPFNSASIHYGDLYSFTNGETLISGATGDLVVRVFSARSLDSVLAFQNPYAPLLVGTSYPIFEYHHETGVGVRVKLTSGYNGNLYLMFSTRNGPVIDMAGAFDNYPDWRTLDNNQVITSGDLYLAAYEALSQANAVFGGDTWGLAATRVREQFGLVTEFVADATAYSPGIVPNQVNFGGTPTSLLGMRGPAYIGMQTPSLFLSNSRVDGYTKNVALLAAAQTAWRTMTGQPNLGPFVPVYHLTNEGMIQYGPAGTFDWAGVDSTVLSGVYQYRPILDLLTLASRLVVGDAVRNSAIAIATNQLKWLAMDNIWHPMWAPFSDDFAGYIERSCALDWKPFSMAHVDQFAVFTNMGSALDYDVGDVAHPMLTQAKRYSHPLFSIPIDWPQRPPLGPPTDFPQGAAQINRPDPHMAAMIMLSVTKLDTLLRPLGDADGEMIIELRAVLHKCMAVLAVMWVTEGEMVGTFSPDPDNREWYGVWHGEIIECLSRVASWARPLAVNRQSIYQQCRSWVLGMVEWARVHSEVYPDAKHYPWTFAPNWRSAIVETFEHSTSIFTSFNGAEQRISMRVKPRRGLSMMHTLKGDDARRYDAVLLAKQNQLLSVPQWHLSNRVTENVIAGQSYFMIDALPAGRFGAGDYIGIGVGSALQFATIKSFTGLRVNLMAPLAEAVPFDAKVLPTDTALLDPQQTSTRRTSQVLEAQTTMDIVPQEDRRLLPDLPAEMTFTVGTDTREVILRKPNRRDALSVGNIWTYNSTASYINGPVRPINGEEQGKRSISGTWSLLDKVQIEYYLGLIKRLHGKRYAAWLPSWTDDFVPSRNTSSKDRIFVKPNAHTELGVLLDPTVGIFITMKDGTVYTARVTQLIPNITDMQLRFDRELAVSPPIADIKMISLMYRVRQMSDTASIRWLTDHVAETNVSFISVFDEPMT